MSLESAAAVSTPPPGRLRRVLGSVISMFYRAPDSAPEAASGLPAQMRKRRKRPTQQLTVSKTRWFQRDLESAISRADMGDMHLAGRLYRALRRDGTIHGLLSTRTGGLVRMRRKFAGDPEIRAALEGTATARPLFDELFPPAELALLAADGIVLGVGIAEMVDVVILTLDDTGELVESVAGKVMRRLDPQFLRYRWDEDRWYYSSASGEIPVTPGDGRWILHTPGGNQEPWNHGLWASLGRGFIGKEHAFLHRENFSAKLANPARVAVAPTGAADKQKESFFRRVMAWGINTVFGLTPGWDVKLLESNGRGYEVFDATIQTSDREFMIALVGQIVTVTGGTGFANAGIHETVRADLIEETGDGLAYTLNTQAIPPWAERTFGGGRRAHVQYDTTPPKNLKEQAESLAAAADAIDKLDAAMARHGIALDAPAILKTFGVPVAGDMGQDGRPEVRSQLSPVQALEAPLTDEAIASLSAKMTEHGIDRCEHNCANRCRLCGIERVRDFDPGTDGSPPRWRVMWRPIGATPTVAPVQEAA